MFLLARSLPNPLIYLDSPVSGASVFAWSYATNRHVTVLVKNAVDAIESALQEVFIQADTVPLARLRGQLEKLNSAMRTEGPRESF